jgi:hypothetical protein
MIIDELAGTEVVIIDDTDREVESLQEVLKKKDIKVEYIKVDLEGDMIQHELISTIKLVFLDLLYGNNYGSFNPNFCAELISTIVPKGKQYYLVAWTKDPDNTEAVVEILKEINLAPIAYTSKLKEDYRLQKDVYDIGRLLEELNKEFEEIKDVQEFYGEIIEVDEEVILINCLLDKEKRIFQVRRFDKGPFENYIDLKVGSYILIKSITKPGNRIFEFHNELQDLSKYFKKEDYFEGLENSSFFK